MALTPALISMIHSEVLKLICCTSPLGACVCVFLKLTGTDNLVSPFCHLMFWHVAGTFFVSKTAFSGKTEWLSFEETAEKSSVGLSLWDDFSDKWLCKKLLCWIGIGLM